MTDLLTICRDIAFDETEIGDVIHFVNSYELKKDPKGKKLKPFWKGTVKGKVEKEKYLIIQRKTGSTTKWDALCFIKIYDSDAFMVNKGKCND